MGASRNAAETASVVADVLQEAGLDARVDPVALGMRKQRFILIHDAHGSPRIAVMVNPQGRISLDPTDKLGRRAAEAIEEAGLGSRLEGWVRFVLKSFQAAERS